MVRADYCGDGQDHTSNGVPIEVEWGEWESGISATTDFEALWNPRGAVCFSPSTLQQLASEGKRSGVSGGLTEIHCGSVFIGGQLQQRKLYPCGSSQAGGAAPIWNFVHD